MEIVPILTSIIVGYFMGNLMASYLITKWVMGFDIREHGTGNAGGSNSFMIMGWKNGLIVGIIDILPGLIIIFLFINAARSIPDDPEVLYAGSLIFLSNFLTNIFTMYTIG